MMAFAPKLTTVAETGLGVMLTCTTGSGLAGALGDDEPHAAANSAAATTVARTGRTTVGYVSGSTAYG
jgi:hypothetical protein